jgi:hypothetical protein
VVPRVAGLGCRADAHGQSAVALAAGADEHSKVRGSSGVPELPRTVIYGGPAGRSAHGFLPYLAAAFGALSPLPGSSGAAAFTTSSANLRWLVSNCSAKS